MWCFPGGTSCKEPACQCRRHKRYRFDPASKILQGKWQPMPIFLPGECHGQRSLVGYSSQTFKESDATEVTQHALRRWGEMIIFKVKIKKEKLREKISVLEVSPSTPCIIVIFLLLPLCFLFVFVLFLFVFLRLYQSIVCLPCCVCFHCRAK